MTTVPEKSLIFPQDNRLDSARPNTTTFTDPRVVRLACRMGSLTTPTSGLAPGYLQANLIILPSQYAPDFRLLCARNPVACPLIAESASPGCFSQLKSHIFGSSVAADLDLRHDLPQYMVYRNSILVKSHALHIEDEWTPDHVAFLIGCSFSFESALAAAGLPPRHVVLNRNVPMYRTSIPLCPAGSFKGGTYVVSMRSYPMRSVERVREVTRTFHATHGEPIAWGWEAVAQLGIENIDWVTWGDAPLALDGRPLGERFGSEDEVPVFWGCGVTPQEAVMKAGIEGTVMAHAPGHMLVIDSRDEDVIS